MLYVNRIVKNTERKVEVVAPKQPKAASAPESSGEPQRKGRKPKKN